MTTARHRTRRRALLILAIIGSVLVLADTTITYLFPGFNGGRGIVVRPWDVPLIVVTAILWFMWQVEHAIVRVLRRIDHLFGQHINNILKERTEDFLAYLEQRGLKDPRGQ